MKAYVKQSLILIGFWFVAALLLSLTVRFWAYLLSVEWSYRMIFWKLYPWGLLTLMIIEILYFIFVRQWLKVYRRETRKGISRDFAFEKACNEARIRAPKLLLSVIVRYRPKCLSL